MKCKAALQVFAITACLSACLTGCEKYKYNEDNLIEEIVEEIVRHHTGTEIDFSPGEKEEGFSPKAFMPLSEREDQE